MKRYVDMADISDGKYYTSGDMVKAGCSGCGRCCKGMGKSIVLDPLDIFRLTTRLDCTFEGLMKDKIELNVVDGIILPNLKMTQISDCCAFLDGQDRCTIHDFRPGICRLFPLGRYYEQDSFKYFLQVHECKNPRPAKVKIKKWLEEPELKRQEAFIGRWHFFLKKIQERLDAKNDDGLRRQASLFILQKFYMEAFPATEDFYVLFEARVEEAEKILGSVIA